MNDTVLLAEAIACASWAGIAAAILWRLRDRQIGAALRVSLGLIVASGVILFGTRLSLATDLDGIGIQWVRFARVAGPLAATIVIWQMHRIMYCLKKELKA